MHLDDPLIQKVIVEIKGSGLPVVIFGAGIAGEVLFEACASSGIKVAAFCDNNINKAKCRLCNLGVIHAPSLKKEYKDAIFLISAADIQDVVNQLRELGYLRWYPASLFLKDFDLTAREFSAPLEFVEYAVGTAIICQDNYSHPDKVFLRSVDIVITERCSLKCRDCSNLMQYYKAPKDSTLDELVRSIDTFCSFVDEINEFRVIGGEPFMNKEYHLILKRLLDEPKVKKVVIYTNGTILPAEDKISCLKNDKVLFMITDYGKLSRKLGALIEMLEREHIAYYSEKARGWTDCASISRHNRLVEANKALFKNCCAKNTATLSNGKLYRCPFSANASRLMAIPDFAPDYIDLFKIGKVPGTQKDIKNMVRSFILGKDSLCACDYCNGRSFQDTEILPAIQITEPLEYKQYDAKK